MPTLTGTIDDVTGAPIGALSDLSVTVRAPVRRASLADQSRLVVSAPVHVAVSADGQVSVDLEPGPAVMLIEGPGLRDVYELGVTADMTLLSEALAESAPDRSWAESQMVQLRGETVQAAGAATDAAGQAAVDRAEIETLRANLVQAAEENAAPHLTQAVLNATYALKGEVPVGSFAPADGSPVYATKTEVEAATNGAIISTNISRQYVSTDPNALPANPGDLLFLASPPPLQFFTDFTEYTVGQAPPDWAIMWKPTNMLTIAEATGSTGGVVLREPPTAAAEQDRGYIWTRIPPRADVEVVMKWRANAATTPIRPGARMVASPRRSYHSGIRNATNHSIYVDGATANTQIANEAMTTVANTWYTTRLRVQGTLIRSRTWASSGAEPTTWLEATDTNVPDPGGVGVTIYSAVGQREIDWFGVGLNGQSAPTQAVAA